MFFLLLPAAIWCGALLATLFISSYGADDRNAGGPCILLILGPVALVTLARAISNAFRDEGGGKALCYGFLWNALMVAGTGAGLAILSDGR